MPRIWTAEQRSAIETREKTLLVSAAAGSGKTTVLTERLIRLITDPEHPATLDRMLIVTFTRAAAAELRARISRALSDALAADPGNRHLHHQLLALSSAKISTIHSYCLELIRTNFQRLGLPAQLRIADAAEASVLAHSIMDAIIERRYAEDAAFGALADHFTGARSDASLADTFLSLYDKLAAYPEGISYLRTSADALRSDALSLSRGWGGVVAANTRRLYADAARIYDDILDEMADDAGLATGYLPMFAADRAHIASVLDALADNSYAPLRSAVNDYAPPRLGRLPESAKGPEAQAYKAARDAFKAARAKLCDDFFPLSSDALALSIAETADAVDALHGLLADYHDRLADEKKRRGICDFSDIERHTLALLTDENGADSDIAHALAEGLDVICIDEYQDVNAVQDRIFRALARPRTRFMVGDIKQSIYRFRGAEPSIFANYRRTFPALDAAPDTEASIFMSNNFRCDKPIIDLSNRIFAYLFGLCGESIGYQPQDDLVCGKASEGYTPHPVTLALCPDDIDPETDDGIPAEYRYIAAECLRLLRDGRLDNGSPIRPSDIAILMRSKSDFEQLSTALAEAGVPVGAGGTSTFFENPEVLMMLCLLNVIDNPNRDVYLAGLLRSPLFGFTMDELITVRRASPDPKEPLYAAFSRYTEENAWEKGHRFLDRLAEYRDMAEGTPVDRLLSALYRDTAVLAYAGAADDESRSPEEKRANLHLLYDYARRFEAGSYKGLYNFIRYIGDIIDEGKEIEAAPAAPGDCVRILSIHQSKGLEFPVCFVAGLGHSFNLRDTTANLLFDHEVGIALRLRDETGFARRTTPIREAIAAHMADGQREEEMRVLYVALTRARERLYLTAGLRKAKSPDEVLEKAAQCRRFGGQNILMQCSTFLDWILIALSGTPEDCYRTVIAQESTIEPLPEPADEPDAPSPIADEALLDTLRQRFDFIYPDEHLTDLPAKLAVSRLYPTLLDDAPLPDALGTPAALPELRQRPAFLDGFAESAEAAGAERGTATHVFLQFCNFARCAANPTPAGIAAEAKRLADAHFITSRMAELLRADELAAFFRSPFYAELAAARWSLRERRFHLYFPAARFTADAALAERLGDEQILVQGVIDLCFENTAGELILCDYKTDRLPTDRSRAAAILHERHGKQLGYYAEACRALFGRAPDRICLWSLALGEAFEM